MCIRTTVPLTFCVLLCGGASAQSLNPLAIPPALDEDTFDLVVDEHVHQFYPGVLTNTYGASAEYLGPTLILHQGDTAHFRVVNQLDAEVTSMHWHGLQVPGEMDGGPPREVMPGDTWNVKYKVKNHAATYWYHPHPHELTAEQANMGVAGMIIVRDDEEAALDLPRTYGVDDIPLVVQDRRFLPNGQFVFGPFGDSVLVNGTPNPYVELPAQVVRLRLLNGSNSRIYRLGFDDDRTFQVIASDGGLLPAPVDVDRLPMSNGERYEVLLDLAGMQGDSLQLKSFGSELAPSMPGSSYILWESSALNGIDFPVLRIRVTAPTANPVTSIPPTLASVTVPDQADVSRTRIKSFSGFGMAGMGDFYINGVQFDMDVVNDTVELGATEEWTVENASDITHPFHIHGVSFYVVERNGAPPPAWETGPKDVVLVDMAENVKLRMKFEELTDGWPFMYHCHNLMHEDNMMMLQYIVEDASVGIAPSLTASDLSVFPSPTSSIISYRWVFPAEQVGLMDMLGRMVRTERWPASGQGQLDLGSLPNGPYVLELRNGPHVARVVLEKE